MSSISDLIAAIQAKDWWKVLQLTLKLAYELSNLVPGPIPVSTSVSSEPDDWDYYISRLQAVGVGTASANMPTEAVPPESIGTLLPILLLILKKLLS